MAKISYVESIGKLYFTMVRTSIHTSLRLSIRHHARVMLYPSTKVQMNAKVEHPVNVCKSNLRLKLRVQSFITRIVPFTWYNSRSSII